MGLRHGGAGTYQLIAADGFLATLCHLFFFFFNASQLVEERTLDSPV